jgi:hypothetical protein
MDLLNLLKTLMPGGGGALNIGGGELAGSRSSRQLGQGSNAPIIRGTGKTDAIGNLKQRLLELQVKGMKGLQAPPPTLGRTDYVPGGGISSAANQRYMQQLAEWRNRMAGYAGSMGMPDPTAAGQQAEAAKFAALQSQPAAAAISGPILAQGQQQDFLSRLIEEYGPYFAGLAQGGR